MMLCAHCGASLRDIMIARLRAAHPQLPTVDIEAVVDFSCAYELDDDDKRAIVDACAHRVTPNPVARPRAMRAIDDDCDCRWKKRTVPRG